MKTVQMAVYVLLITLALHLFLRMSGLHWLELVDPASAFFVMACLPFVLLSYRFSEVLQALMQGFGVSSQLQAPELSDQILATLGKQMLVAGGVSTLLGIVQALGNLDEMQALGAGLAISLLGLVYAVAAYLVFLLPMRAHLQREMLLQKGGEGL
ncbi:MAG: hypothetical protein ACO1RX_03855 [Candidatus Sericytochromatia bacterium]